jgi:hypothetical protein
LLGVLSLTGMQVYVVCKAVVEGFGWWWGPLCVLLFLLWLFRDWLYQFTRFRPARMAGAPARGSENPP